MKLGARRVPNYISDIIPVRELFPRRICLRITAKSHISITSSAIRQQP
jgi:hypothetical protein